MRELIAHFPVQEALTSFVFLAAIVVLRFILIRLTMRGNSDILSKDQRRWITRIKNTALILSIIGLMTIWAPQLETFALSLVAIAVAIVVALKEVILGLTASFVRVTTTPFRVGDWVILDGQAGEVIDVDAFTTRMQEVDLAGRTYQYTGRTIVVPNGKLFTANVINLRFTKSHLFHDVTVTVAHNDVDPAALLESFKSIVNRHYIPYRKEAGATIRGTIKETGLALPREEPILSIRTTDFGHYVLGARLFLPVGEILAFSSAVIAETLAKAQSLRVLHQRNLEDYKRVPLPVLKQQQAA
jgi:small-conductance mechanosensitive channel